MRRPDSKFTTTYYHLEACSTGSDTLPSNQIEQSWPLGTPLFLWRRPIQWFLGILASH